MCLCSVVLFTGGGIAPSEAGVKVNGKSLGSIYDIVKEATNSGFPDIPKHSLLIYERHQNGNWLRYKSSILTISADGSVRKTFGGFVDDDSRFKAVNPSTSVVQKIDLAMSAKPFGNSRNIVYATSGINWSGCGSGEDPDGRYGFQTINSVGTEDHASITLQDDNH